MTTVNRNTSHGDGKIVIVPPGTRGPHRLAPQYKLPPVKEIAKGDQVFVQPQPKNAIRKPVRLLVADHRSCFDALELLTVTNTKDTKDTKNQETKAETGSKTTTVAKKKVSTPSSGGFVLVSTNPPAGGLDSNGAYANSLPQDTTIGKQITVTITSQQLLALHTTPVTIIPAPGAGKYLFITQMFLDYTYGGSPYTTGSTDFTLYYGDPATDVAAIYYMASVLSAMVVNVSQSNSYAGNLNQTNPPLLPMSNLINQPIVLGALFTALTSGNGTLRITLNYQTVTLP